MKTRRSWWDEQELSYDGVMRSKVRAWAIRVCWTKTVTRDRERERAQVSRENRDENNLKTIETLTQIIQSRIIAIWKMTTAFSLSLLFSSRIEKTNHFHCWSVNGERHPSTGIECSSCRYHQSSTKCSHLVSHADATVRLELSRENQSFFCQFSPFHSVFLLSKGLFLVEFGLSSRTTTERGRWSERKLSCESAWKNSSRRNSHSRFPYTYFT